MLLITNFKLSLIIIAGSATGIDANPDFWSQGAQALSGQSGLYRRRGQSYAGEIIQHIKTVQSFTHEEQEKALLVLRLNEPF